MWDAKTIIDKNKKRTEQTIKNDSNNEMLINNNKAD